jgi:hypothetical protein
MSASLLLSGHASHNLITKLYMDSFYVLYNTIILPNTLLRFLFLCMSFLASCAPSAWGKPYSLYMQIGGFSTSLHELYPPHRLRRIRLIICESWRCCLAWNLLCLQFNLFRIIPAVKFENNNSGIAVKCYSAINMAPLLSIWFCYFYRYQFRSFR